MVNKIINRKKYIFHKNWRNQNTHNFTFPINIFDASRVEVDNYTYGPLNIKNYGNPDERLVIGAFCSIASDVVFILGGNHEYKSLSSYPFNIKLLKNVDPEISLSKGQITVEDDVWIGFGSTILSGVTIGQGAVIGAKTVVSKNIPPYAIVVGNPGQIIKYRFSKDIINDLVELKPFQSIDISTIKNNPDILRETINTETMIMIKKIISSRK